jgi:formate/nitrite transporter FocA (FNT family)
MSATIRQSLFAGILIGLGAFGYLALGGVLGAIIFSFGLVGVVLTDTLLYTGKAGVLTNIWDLLVIWFFNVLACVLIGLMVKYLGGEPVERAKEMIANRLAVDYGRVFVKALGCGLIIDFSCSIYRTSENLIPVLIGVPLFILCGFYHSIADVVYMVAAWNWTIDLLWFYLLIFLGNYVGCNVRRIINIITKRN